MNKHQLCTLGGRSSRWLVASLRVEVARVAFIAIAELGLRSQYCEETTQLVLML